MKKILRVQFALLSLVAVGLVALLLAGLFGQWGSWSFSGFSFKPGNYPLDNRQTLSAAGLHSISLDYSYENIILLPSPGGDIVLEEYLPENNGRFHAVIKETEGKLSITAGERDVFRFGFFTFRMPLIKLYLPQSYVGSLRLTATSGAISTEADWSLASLEVTLHSGSIRFAGVATAEDATFTATSGSIRIGSFTGGGSLAVKASSGSLRLGDIAAKDILLTVTSGSIKAEKAAGNIAASTSSGAIKIEDFAGSGSFECTSGALVVSVSAITGDLSFSTSSGSQRVTLPRGASFHFSASIGSGSLRTAFDGQLTFSNNRKEAAGSVGTAPQHTVTCRATSGSIRVETA